MIYFLILALCFSGVAAVEDPSTVSPSVFRSILCRHHFLSGSADCRNRTDDQREGPVPTYGPTVPIVPTVPSVHVSVHFTMSVGTKIAIAVGVSFIFYLGLVLFIKFRIGYSWARSLALGLNAGRLTARCYIYIYPRPNDEVAVSEV